MKRNHATPSRYTQLGFTSLKIKIDTKNRLNIAKSQIFAREGKSVSHDELMNRLLDRHEAEIIEAAHA